MSLTSEGPAGIDRGAAAGGEAPASGPGATAIYRARWVLPVATPPIRDGAVLVGGDGRIAAVGPASALDAAADTPIVELGDAALLPGLVNVHAHPELAMFRGALEDLPFGEWILRLVGGKRRALREEDSDAAARWTVVESLRAGITTIGATESSGAAVRALSEGGMRGVVYREVFGPEPGQAEASMAELREALEALGSAASPLVRVGISPHAPFTVSDRLYESSTRLALESGLPMAVHIAESRAERELVVAGDGPFAAGLRARGIETPPRGRSPIGLLARLGVLEARPLLVHCVDVDAADVETIAASGCPVAHCPVANAKLGHGLAPLPVLREAGVTVGLGTDSVASNNRLDLLEEARVAALLQRARHARPDLLPAEELLRLCTIEGARALGLDDRVGTLEPGKEADLCAVALGGAHVAPVHDPLAALFHAARAADVRLSVVAGRLLFRDGEHLTVDVERARAGVEEAARRLREDA